MAMKECKECKKEVSSKTNKCPHCGVSNPTTTAKEMFQGMAVLFGLVLFGVVMCSDDDSLNKTPEEMAAEEVGCRTNLQCWADKHYALGATHCQTAVEKMATYSHEWVDGMMDPKFSRYVWNDQDKGVITYVGDKIKLQNGFGAWQNYIYACNYDTINEFAVKVAVEPGRL